MNAFPMHCYKINFVLCIFSFNQPHHVHTLEQSSAGGGDSSVDSCIYEYNGTKVCLNIY